MTSAAAASISVQTAGRSARLWATVFAHAAVDFFSFIVVPLMSVLEGRVQMSHAQGAVILAAGSLSSGLIQPVVAWLSDRFDTRAVGTLGFLVAVIAIGLVGYAGSFNQLLLLQVLGAGGIGAFHPVAAAAVGQLAAPRRSRGVALFYAAGMVGGTLGNITAPVYVSVAGGTGRGEADTVAGLHALAWLILPGLVCVALLAWAIHSVPHRDHGAHRLHAELPAQQRRQRWRAVWLLYAGNVLRFMVDMCLIQLIIRWTEWQAMRAAGTEVLTAAIRADASHLNGPLQAAKQVGMGAGGIAMGFLLRPRHEKRVLIWVPIAGAAVVALMPHFAGWTALLVCGLAGVGYAGVVPTTISLAQRLLPHRTSLASGLMMGGAWSIASVGPLLAQFLLERFGLGGAFACVGVLLIGAGVLAAWLPARLVDPADRPGV